MNKRVLSVLILVFLVHVLASCDLSFGYKPPGIPLSVSIDTQGQVTFSVEKGIEIPTNLGTFSIGVVLDPAKYFKTKNTLTIRYNGEDHFYDLHGEDFKVDFESGCYDQITLIKTGTNLFIELSRIPSCSILDTASSGTISSQAECNEIFPPRLRVGGLAKVVVWQVKARVSPSKYSSTINYFAENRILHVIDGPICSDGWYWWNLYSDELGYSGWVAEADEENYFVSPY